MSLENAILNLQTFGIELGLHDLEFDSNNTCILGIDDAFSMHLTYEPNSDRLYLYSPLLDGLPEDPDIRETLSRVLLEGAMLGGQMAGGGVGVATSEGLILMHVVLEMEVCNPEKLTKFAPLFVETVERWREIVKQICERGNWESLLEAMKSKIGMGLNVPKLLRQEAETLSRELENALAKLRGGLWFEQGAAAFFIDALDKFERLSKSDRLYFPVARCLGLYFACQHRFEEAQTLLEECLKAEEYEFPGIEKIELKNRLAMCKIGLGDFDSGLALYQETMEVFMKSEDGHWGRNAYSHSAFLYMALSSFSKKEIPVDALVKIIRCVFIVKNDFELANSRYENCYNRNIMLCDFLLSLAKWYGAAKDYDIKKELLQKLKEDSPGFEKINTWLSQAEHPAEVFLTMHYQAVVTEFGSAHRLVRTINQIARIQGLEEVLPEILEEDLVVSFENAAPAMSRPESDDDKLSRLVGYLDNMGDFTEEGALGLVDDFLGLITHYKENEIDNFQRLHVATLGLATLYNTTGQFAESAKLIKEYLDSLARLEKSDTSEAREAVERLNMLSEIMDDSGLQSFVSEYRDKHCSSPLLIGIPPSPIAKVASHSVSNEASAYYQKQRMGENGAAYDEEVLRYFMYVDSPLKFSVVRNLGGHDRTVLGANVMGAVADSNYLLRYLCLSNDSERLANEVQKFLQILTHFSSPGAFVFENIFIAGAGSNKMAAFFREGNLYIFDILGSCLEQRSGWIDFFEGASESIKNVYFLKDDFGTKISDINIDPLFIVELIDAFDRNLNNVEKAFAIVDDNYFTTTLLPPSILNFQRGDSSEFADNELAIRSHHAERLDNLFRDFPLEERNALIEELTYMHPVDQVMQNLLAGNRTLDQLKRLPPFMVLDRHFQKRVQVPRRRLGSDASVRSLGFGPGGAHFFLQGFAEGAATDGAAAAGRYIVGRNLTQRD